VPAPEPGSPPQKASTRVVIAKWTRRALAVVVAVVAALILLVFSVDLGRFPDLKARAERAASNWLQRPVHIGKLGASLVPGVFTVDEVVIDGKHPGDRPFFRAGRVYVYVPLWSLAARRANLPVQLWLTDWQMTVENFPDGHNMPRLTGPKREPGRPLWFTTTVTAYASGGQFIYDDHLLPWSVRAPNLNFALVRADNLKQYVGVATFSGGGVKIQNYPEMATSLNTRFVLDGPRVQLQHIDLTTDGSMCHVNGTTDFANWPEQTYNTNCTVDFARMREIFFADQTWRLNGTGQFAGVFHLPKAGGRLLAGDFTSDDVMVNDLRFRSLHGSLEWTPEHFVVSHADAELLDGDTRFNYSIAPLGKPGGSTMTFAADYQNLDLSQINRLVNLKSLELAGRADGSLSLQWPSGKLASGRQGHGHTLVRPPGNVPIAAALLPEVPRPILAEPQPFASSRPLTPLVVSADVEYTLDPGGWEFEDSWAATPFTHVQFKGRLARDLSSNFPFHVTSHDWQESDRVLARIMTAVAGPTGAIEVGGRGTFDGVMTGSFSAPRIAGHLKGDSTRVWDVVWGGADAEVVIEGGYVQIAKSRFGDRPDSYITADGTFALGFRRDNREEIRANVALVNWVVADLRHAFSLDDWSFDGRIGRANLKLTGRYKEMFGSGDMRIDDGIAWGEHFESATGDIELGGSELRVHRIRMLKNTGVVTGDARIGWDGTYNFEAHGERIPIESLDNFKVPQQELSGQLTFDASGGGEFENPDYRFDGSVPDLFVGNQGVGYMRGQIRVRGKDMLIERLVANSPLLDLEGAGTIKLNERYDSTFHVRFTESSVKPYLDLFVPRLSPWATATMTGSVDVIGPLSLPKDLTINAAIDTANLDLLGYQLENLGQVQLAYDKQIMTVKRLELRGENTSLKLTGGADVRARSWNLAADGDASLSILQLFLKAAAASGAATLNATLTGSFDAPRLNGKATVTNGRLRPFSSIHSLEAVNGVITFGDSGINVDGLNGRIGGGDVTFGGNIAVEGYTLSEYNLTVTGRSMVLRYPTGFQSTANMDLQLVGTLAAPRLIGTIDVLRVRPVTSGSNLRELAGFGAAGGGLPAPGPAAPPALEQGTPVGLDIRVTAPRMYLINTGTDRIEASADFRLSGTFDRPAFTGQLDILGGELLFNGNRYFVREGSIRFTSPDRVEPVFDLTAETRPRVDRETYNISINVSGPLNAMKITPNSDPYLPTDDIYALLFGGTPNVDTAEQRALRSPQESQQRMMQSAMTTLFTSAISDRVGNVVERFSGCDAVQITPVLVSEVAFQQINPSARFTCGKRIGPRAFLTYARTVGVSAVQDELILLEYEQNERVSWILSRNENRTFALDFRIRYTR